MKNRIRESLSALCDGECDELELRRVLNHVENDAELREQWNSFHLIGATMRGEAATRVDLSKGIMQAIDGEPMDEIPGRKDTGAQAVPTELASQPVKKGLPAWMVSGSVAASVTLAVLLGARALTDSATGPLSEPVSSAIVASTGEAVQNSSSGEVVEVSGTEHAVAQTAVNSSFAALDSISADELAAAQESLRQYVLEHEDQSFGIRSQSPAPYARVANFGSSDDGLRDSVRAELKQSASHLLPVQGTSGK